ncbi:hypothetical protein [Blastococcus litoris]|uniref:hypothetical protein n=1 Tax=Blastococcus litoris TaxID=2171622 RepID=UPI000E302579|nr:hypothetical protein [Blastococcus litoris]
MDRHRRTSRAVLAAVLAVVVTGCTAPDRTSERPAAAGTTTEAAAADVTGVLLQFRRDVARGRVEVRLTASAEDLAVDGLELVAPGLTARPGDPRGAALRPGTALDFPVVVAGDCAVAPGPPAAVVHLRDGAGAARQATVPLEDDGLVRRLHDGLCFADSLLRQVAIEVVDLREVEGPALRATVRLRRLAGDDPVRLTRVDPNTVYDISPVGPLPQLDGDGAVSGDLRLVPARCDVHALGESYRTGLIGLVVEVGDEEPRSFVLTPDPAVRQRIEAFAVETCREGAD